MASSLVMKMNHQGIVVGRFFQRSLLHISVPSKQGVPYPSNVEEIAAGTKMGFSADRHKNMSHGISQSQTTSMFSGSFMSDQSSQGFSSPADQSLVDSYNSLGSMSLNAVTQTNVPQPFSPVIDVNNTPRLNMPESSNIHENKFTASDLQQTLHPSSSSGAISGDSGMSRKVRFYSSSTNNVPAESTKAKLKRAVKDYGATVIVFHVTISIASLSLSYAAVASGLDVPGMLVSLGISSEMLNSKLSSGASTFLVAYALHKVFTPVRMSITLASVPFIVRYLRRIGFLKVTPPS